jgi:intraflagellar transport protein 172
MYLIINIIGQKFENIGKYKDAEKLYITVDEPDIAINMYKKAG